MSKHWAAGICLDALDTGKPVSILLVCEPTDERKDEKDAWRWSLPGEKCCDDKRSEQLCCEETPRETLKREFREETGFEVEPVEVLLQEEKVNRKDGREHQRFIFLVKIVGGEALKKKAFNQESPKWFFLAKLPRNLFPSHLRIIRESVLSLLHRNLTSSKS